MVKKIRISMEQLSKIAVKLFLGMGFSELEAAYAADVLVETDRRGVDTHGITRLDFYHMCVNTENISNKKARLRVLRDDPPYLMIDADCGLGIVMAPQAVELAISKAKEHGICIMGVQNSGHFGAAGYYAVKCVEQGFISMVCSNSPATMAPVGGRERMLGNSPWSIAFPGGNRYPDPVMFDMACSEVSRGKCETAHREGMTIPLNWGIDKNGEPSTDPAAVLYGGSLLPFGGVKGYCIALLIEVLSSMLTFASFGEGKSPGGVFEYTGHFVLLMDPSRFGSTALYKESIDNYVESIKNSQLATGADEIIIPGELEARSIIERTKNGMELDETVAASLAQVAIECGLLTKDQRFEDMLLWQ